MSYKLIFVNKTETNQCAYHKSIDFFDKNIDKKRFFILASICII